MKSNMLKRSISFIFALVLILSSFSVPVVTGVTPTIAVTASAASAKKLSKVTGLKASSGVSSVSLSWKKVSGAAGYNVCRYDTAKKKYVSVASVTGTKATVKKLQSATTYRFAVRAYKKSGKKTVYGAFSSQAIVATCPKKVSGLKAARTENSVTLKWNTQSGVTGYAVYRYDAAKKKYVSAGKTKEDSLTVKGLKKGTAYYFTVKAYVTANKTNYYSAASDKLKVQTLKSGYKISRYHKIVSGGKYTVEAVMKDTGSSESIPLTMAYKNGDFAMKSKVEGIEARIVHYAKSGKTYIVLDQFKQYTTLNDSEIDEMMNDLDFANSFATPVYGNIKTGTKTISGQKYYYESFKNIESNKVVCYFKGSDLVRVDSYEDGKCTGTVKVSKFTSSVDDALFKIPRYYGYLNLSWLNA